MSLFSIAEGVNQGYENRFNLRVSISQKICSSLACSKSKELPCQKHIEFFGNGMCLSLYLDHRNPIFHSSLSKLLLVPLLIIISWDSR